MGDSGCHSHKTQTEESYEALTDVFDGCAGGFCPMCGRGPGQASDNRRNDSRAELKAKCAAAQGGIFLNEKGGGYSYYATGSVTCDAKGKCTGIVPRRQTTNGGRTGAIGGKTKAFGATRVGGTQRTHGAPPTSAAMIQRCWKHHC